MSFECKSPKIKKYSEWLGTDDQIFMRPYINKIPKLLKYCEELFDKDVPEIKKSFQNFEQYMNINPINI